MVSFLYLLYLLLVQSVGVSAYTFAQPQAKQSSVPYQEKNVAVLGGGGYSGALVFGFLQRAAHQYGKGIDHVGSIGATYESAHLLNRYLAKSFYTSTDQSQLIITNLFDVQQLAEYLWNYDALILGTDIGVAVRPVSENTYRTRNDHVCEVYWPAPKKLEGVPQNAEELRHMILRTVLQAARVAEIQHICLVDDAKDQEAVRFLHSTGVPYTVLGPTASKMIDCPGYTYRKGVLEKLKAENLQEQQGVESSVYLHREDMSALAVQALMSADWSRSRCLAVTSIGRADTSYANRSDRGTEGEWCPNAHVLEQALGIKPHLYM